MNQIATAAMPVVVTIGGSNQTTKIGSNQPRHRQGGELSFAGTMAQTWASVSPSVDSQHAAKFGRCDHDHVGLRHRHVCCNAPRCPWRGRWSSFSRSAYIPPKAAKSSVVDTA